MLVGRAGEDEVLVARVDGALFAIGARCSHYQGPLGEGLLVGHTVRCPWHHARFCLRTGEAVGAPAIDPVRCWSAIEHDGKVFVQAEAESAKPASKPPASQGPRRIVIAGGGAGGFATAEMLRRQGFDGGVTLVSAEPEAPYDRPNCSKDYLAGEAPAEWMPLREKAWYRANDIDLRLGAAINALDLGDRNVALASGETFGYDALVLALGAEPARPPIPGLDQPDVHVLRTLRDADAIALAAGRARRVAVVGASFIGLEVAASLRHRGLEVHVLAPEPTPLAKVLGTAVGEWIRALHERNGVVFHLGRQVRGYLGGRLGLDNGETLEVDFVVAGTGVRPRVELARQAGLNVEDGVVVDRWLRTDAAGVFAVGDIARYPDAHSRELIRVEHWVHAERQGQHVARAIMGDDRAYADAPFFWSAHYAATIRYVGHAQAFDPPRIEGSLENDDAAIRYQRQGRTLALATIGRDLEALRAGRDFEA